VVTLDETPIVFEILTFNASKWFVFSPLPYLTPRSGGGALEFMDETYPAETRGTGLSYGENIIILTSTVVVCSVWRTDRQTDGRTNGR